MPPSLWNRGFIALLITQFTVAFNDNVFRWLLVFIGVTYMPESRNMILFLGAAFLVLPFILWASIAGFITDRFSRRNTVIACKTIELVLLAIAIFVICWGPAVSTESTGVPAKIFVLLGILFLLGSQSTVFSPSKYGLIPDLVPDKSISVANGYIAMLTMLAIVSGQVVGGCLFDWTTLYDENSRATGIPGGNNIGLTALILLGAATIGLLTSFFIPKMKPVDANAQFPKNPFAQTGKDLAVLFSYRALFWVAVASAFFWGLSALAQNNIEKFASTHLMVLPTFATLLGAVLIIGIGAGAVLCGYLSGKRIELGLVPIGAFFTGLFILILGFTPGYGGTVELNQGSPLGTPYLFGAVVMLLAGLGAGLYDIPLAAYIQKNSPPTQRGRMIAAYNFCTFSAVLLFAGLGLAGATFFESLGWDSGGASLMIWIATGLLTLAACALLLYLYTAQFWIFFFRSLTWLIYRPKHVGVENIPATGGALLVCNHISLLDGFLLYFACPRNIRYIAHQAMIPKMFECCVRETKLIKIAPGSPKNVIKAIREAREALQNGELVAVFAEGGITRNGQMRVFEPGFMSMLKGVTAPDGKPIPIIPCHIGGLQESMFSYKYAEQRVIFRPRKLVTDVIVSFGKPMTEVKYPQQVQLAVQELGVDSHRRHNTKRLPIPSQSLIRASKKRGKRLMFADSTGRELDGYKFLTATLALRYLLRTHVLDSRENEPHVGVLAPMSVGGSVLNAALGLDRRVPINLNFTFGAEGINYCIQQAGIKRVLTSKRVLERFPNLQSELNAEVISTEDLLTKLDNKTKLKYFLTAKFLPSWLLERMLGLTKKDAGEDLMTIIYTSGSTGQPKGVMLTNNNIAEVARGFVAAQKLTEKDSILGFLPFFHAFGLMGNFWLPIFCGGQGIFHFSPLEPKKVAEMARKYPITFMPSTPTFLRSFYRYCPKEDFEKVPGIVCGAEKFPLDLIDLWHEKYGVRPTEGFGATELSPVMTTCVPESRVSDKFHTYRKDGSIGRALCNLVVKVIDLETGEDLPPNGIGMIVAKGPTVMKGYYKQPEKTAEVIKEGWYSTGDVGKIDEDGFVWVTGRESRISKIGGEMIPHILIEEEIFKILSEEGKVDSESNEPPAAVTAVPHPTRGEQLIVLYRDESISPEKLVERLLASSLPRIWIPRVEGFIKVDSIPILGTGKLDLGAVKRMAMAER